MSTMKFLKDSFVLTLYCSPTDADMFLEELNRSNDFDSHWFVCNKKLGICEARVRILNKDIDGAKISEVKQAIDKIVEKFEKTNV